MSFRDVIRLVEALAPFVADVEERIAIERRMGGNVESFKDSSRLPTYVTMGAYRRARQALDSIGDAEPGPECLWDERYHRYAGTCRFCGFRNRWVVEKRGGLAEYSAFLRVAEGYAPGFPGHCPECGNRALFDLTAWSPETPPECECVCHAGGDGSECASCGDPDPCWSLRLARTMANKEGGDG